MEYVEMKEIDPDFALRVRQIATKMQAEYSEKLVQDCAELMLELLEQLDDALYAIGVLDKTNDALMREVERLRGEDNACEG